MYITSIERNEWAQWIQKRGTPISAALKFAGVTPSAVTRVLQGEQINLQTETVEKIRAAIASETPALDRIAPASIGETVDIPPVATATNNGNNGTGYYRDPRWLKLRDQCFDLHPHCFACGTSTDRQLQAHHIRYNRSTDGLPYWLVPVSDLITVCVEHHDEITAGWRDLHVTLSLIPHYPETFHTINRFAKAITEVIQDCRRRHSAPVIEYDPCGTGEVDARDNDDATKQEMQSWSMSRYKR